MRDVLADLEERSFWQATMPALPDRRQRELPERADVVVIGGGYTGLSAARRAAQLGASVVVLEAERIGWGASTRNGGMCHPGYKWGPAKLVRRHGEALGRQLYEDSIDAFESVADLCSGPIDADFVRSGHLELAYAPGHVDHLARAARTLAGVGMAAHVIDRADLRDEIGSDAYFGGLVVERSGGLHPGKLLAGLAALAEGAGAGLHEGIRARRIRRVGARSIVETSARPIDAGLVIVATNGYTDAVAPRLRRRILPISSYIIVTEPLPADLAAEISPRGRMFFDTKNFLYYWRLTPDRRLLFGGRASMWPTTVRRTAAILQRGMVRVHPQLAGTRVAYAWGGKVGFTFDRMPHVGRSGDVAWAVGCCGSGVAIMPWLGERVADWVLGGAPAPALASLRFPLVPAPYEGRAWFLPLAGEWWKTQDRIAAWSGRRADQGVARDPQA